MKTNLSNLVRAGSACPLFRADIIRLLLTAPLLLAITLTSCGKGGGDVKLLESTTDADGKVLQKFEYDDKNRIVKIIEGTTTKTITYNSDDLVTVGETKYVIKGNTITVESKDKPDTLTINEDGYIVKNGYDDVVKSSDNNTYQYENGNLTNISRKGKDFIGASIYNFKGTSIYKYDDKKSPFSNSNTPKWLIKFLFGDKSTSKNNVLSENHFDEYSDGGIIASTTNYKYEYDSDGFPITVTSTSEVEGNEETATIRYIYRSGKTETAAAADTTKPAAEEAAKETESDTLVVDETRLIFITTKYSDLVAEYGEEDAEVVADDGNWYEYLTREYFEKLGIENGSDENKRYISFALDNGKNYVIDTKTESGIYLYKKGKKPMSILMAEGDYSEDYLKEIVKYLQMDLSEAKKRMKEREEAKEKAKAEAEANLNAALAKATIATIEYINAAREKALKEKRTLTDSRDGKTYIWAKIGKQVWMAENLNYNAEGSKCYRDEETNCDKFGRLYNWETAMKACPQGWHLPQDAEWQTLVDLAGGDVAGKSLKASSGWVNDGNGTDAFGFSALPVSFGNSSGVFGSTGSHGEWWTATEIDADNAYRRGIAYYSETAGKDDGNKSFLLHSIRCIKD